VVKKHARRLGLDPAACAGHSVTLAVGANAPITKIAEQTRHRRLDMLRVYSRAPISSKTMLGLGFYDAITRRTGHGGDTQLEVQRGFWLAVGSRCHRPALRRSTASTVD
jgi:hypothetical protein